MKQITVALFCFFALNTNAQLWQAGFGALCYNQTGSTISSYYSGNGSGAGIVRASTSVKEFSNAPQLGVNYYHALFSPKRSEYSAGIQTGFIFFAYYRSADAVQNQYGQVVGSKGGDPLVIGYQIPLYAMGRFGSLSGEDADKGIGAAIGAGPMLLGFNIPNEKGIMLPFTLGAEICYNRIGIRFDLPLKKYKSVYQSYTGDIPRITTAFYSAQITLALE